MNDGLLEDRTWPRHKSVCNGLQWLPLFQLQACVLLNFVELLCYAHRLATVAIFLLVDTSI